MIGHYLAVLLLCFIVITQSKLDSSPPRIGFAFSGAGGRIAQHLALAKVLLEGLSPNRQAIRPSYLSGASSGALSSVLLNAVIESSETNRIKYTWDHLIPILFNLTTSQVVDTSVLGIAKVPINMAEGFILDNTPLENFLKQQLQQVGYSKLGDLYIPTSISVFNQSSGATYRFWSDDPKYKDLDLLEVLMASTALPIAFTPRTITGFGDTVWIDGGTGIDTLPVIPLIDRMEVDEIYTVCYGSAFTSGGDTIPYYFNHIPLLKNALAVIDDMRVEFFISGLDLVQRTSKPAYTYIPVLNQTFGALDFDDEKLEFALAMNWGLQNNPLRVNLL